MFGFFNKKSSATPVTKSPTSPVKKFSPPKKFEYNWLLALRLMACESRGNFSCSISAECGTVTLRINGIRDLCSLTREYASGAYNYFFLHPTYNDGSLRMTFYEPDCYIFGCPREGVECDLSEYAKNAYVSAWYENDGRKQIMINFDPYPSEEETERWDVFMNYYKIWCS